MGISISNATSSAITKYSVSLRSGEPDWSMIPSAGKSNKSQAEFVSEIKELAQRAANTTSKTELESIHRQRTRLCAEYISDVSPDRKALYQQAKNAVKSQNGNPKCKGIGELSLLDFLERAEGKNNNLAQKKFALAGGGTLECPILTGEGYGADISYQGTKVLPIWEIVMDGDAKELRLSGKRKENFTEFTSMNTIRKRMPKAQN